MATSQSGYSLGGSFKWTTQRKFCPVINVKKKGHVWSQCLARLESESCLYCWLISKYFCEGLYFQLSLLLCPYLKYIFKALLVWHENEKSLGNVSSGWRITKENGQSWSPEHEKLDFFTGLGWVNYLCFLNGLRDGKDTSQELPIRAIHKRKRRLWEVKLNLFECMLILRHLWTCRQRCPQRLTKAQGES